MSDTGTSTNISSRSSSVSPQYLSPIICQSSPSHSSALPNDAVGRYRGGSRTPHINKIEQNNPIIGSIQSTVNEIRQRFKPNDVSPTVGLLPTFLSGTFAFYATAFSSQYVQHRFLKMSTGTRPAILPISVGVATVALGSWMGHLAGLGTAAAWGTVQNSWNNNKMLDNIPKIGGTVMRSVGEMTRPMKIFAEGMSKSERRERKEAWMHAGRICILGLLTYKTIFRSRYVSISPSSYTARGSFGPPGIPAPANFNYATRLQREKIERIGRRWGCHTCGSRMIFSNLRKNVPKFHGDHIPPVSVAKQLNDRWYRRTFGLKVSQKFYPQCRDCSNKQGGMLSKAIKAGHRNLRSVGGGEESYFHGRRLRVGHLTGGAVAVVSVDAASDVREGDLVESSRQRVLSFQDWIEDLGSNLKERAEAVWRSSR